VLKRIVLVLALLFGALAVTQGPSYATPLGASAQTQKAAPAQAENVQYYYYRRPRYYGYRYYRPRYYRPRYYRPRYYRPRYRFYF